MWPRFNNKKMPLSRVDSLESLIESAGDLSFLQKNNSEVRFWVPELVGKALKNNASFRGETMAYYIRSIFFRHCYGEYILIYQEQLQYHEAIDYKKVDYHKYMPLKDPIYWVPQLGKNIYPIKLALPSKTNRDLHKLANHYSITVSQYLRETIISNVFGHGMVPGRPDNEMEKDQADIADQWSLKDSFEPVKAISNTENGKAFYFDDEDAI